MEDELKNNENESPITLTVLGCGWFPSSHTLMFRMLTMSRSPRYRNSLWHLLLHLIPRAYSIVQQLVIFRFLYI